MPPLGFLRVDDEIAALDVSHDHVGPDRDALCGVQGNSHPFLTSRPDATGVVRAVDGLGHQGCIAHHALDAATHEPRLLVPDEYRLSLLSEGGHGLGGVLGGEVEGLAAGLILDGLLHGGH